MSTTKVVVDESGAAAGERGPYHLVLESVGGEVLGNALSMLAPGGTCVSFGSSASAEVGEIARRLIERGYTGKAILRVDR
jgi:NADPH:quinone reductase